MGYVKIIMTKQRKAKVKENKAENLPQNHFQEKNVELSEKQNILGRNKSFVNWGGGVA